MPESLCFLYAATYLAVGRISEKEYLDALLAHLKGVRHDLDKVKGGGLTPLYNFEASLRSFILDNEITHVEDTSLYESLMIALWEDKHERAIEIFQMLENNAATPAPLQPAAVIAAGRGQALTLEYFLDRGAIFDVYLDRACYYGAKNSAMLDLLYRVNWRDMKNSSAATNGLLKLSVKGGTNSLDWLLEHGARMDPKDLRNTAFGNVEVKKFARVVEASGGISVLKGSGALQAAASSGNMEMIEYLLKQGMNVDDRCMSPHLRIETTALFWAVESNRIDVVQHLLDHGAAVDQVAGKDGATKADETPFQTAKRTGNQAILDLLENHKGKDNEKPADTEA